MRLRREILGLFLLIGLQPATVFSQKPALPDGELLDPGAAKKDLYPSTADAQKEIEEAQKKSFAEKKRVLLVVGANWCYNCHVLDRPVREGEAGEIVKKSF